MRRRRPGAPHGRTRSAGSGVWRGYRRWDRRRSARGRPVGRVRSRLRRATRSVGLAVPWPHAAPFTSFLAAAAATAWAAMVSAPVPVASAAPCPDVEVVFARAAAELPGVGGLGQAFVDALRSDIGGKSVAIYPVNYVASSNLLYARQQRSPAAENHQTHWSQFGNSLARLNGWDISVQPRTLSQLSEVVVGLRGPGQPPRRGARVASTTSAPTEPPFSYGVPFRSDLLRTSQSQVCQAGQALPCITGQFTKHRG
jgi:Cutinase